MSFKVLFSNIGYAKGIDGSLAQHVMLFSRHFYNTISVQQQVLLQLKKIISEENPDVCCFVEIDGGSLHSAYHNQVSSLLDDDYKFHDITGKYGENDWISRMIFHKGKSNAFVSRTELPFEKLYFKFGTKRLIYKISLPGNICLFFAHFSLNWKTRIKQMEEVKALIAACQGEVIVMADFNIMRGYSELAMLLEDKSLTVLNDDTLPTFTFHKRQMALDVCIVSTSLAERSKIKIINQPFSDHKALLIEI